MPRMIRIIAVLASAAGVGCGDLTVPAYNNPTIETLTNTPSPGMVQSTALGILVGWRRRDADLALGLTTFGREAWEIRPSTPSLLRGRVLTPIGLSVYLAEFFDYGNVRLSYALLDAIDKVTGMTETQREATRGWAKTVLAVEFLRHIATRDTFGLPLDVAQDPLQATPIATKTEVYQRIFQLLDQAKTHLQNGGAAFPFQLPSGFGGFNTPSTFTKVNRALKARAQVYFNDWNGALASLAESFLDPGAPLDLGAYHTYSANSGDQSNPLLSSFYANDRILTEAQLRPDGSRDLRATSKVVAVPAASLLGVTASLAPAMFRTPTSPHVIIKNEELILLRAEANLGLGNRALALTDINLVRQASGGLAPIADPGGSGLLNELLYNKRYSLWFEWGHAWIDMRHYGKILEIPRYRPEFLLFDVIPFPLEECADREPEPKGCVVVNGR